METKIDSFVSYIKIMVEWVVVDYAFVAIFLTYMPYNYWKHALPPQVPLVLKIPMFLFFFMLLIGVVVVPRPELFGIVDDDLATLLLPCAITHMVLGIFMILATAYTFKIFNKKNHD